MLHYFMQCVWAGLFLTAVSIIWFFVVDAKLHWAWRPWLAIWTYFLVRALLLIARNEILMRRLLLRFLEEQADH